MTNGFEIRGDYAVILLPHKDGMVYETKIDLEDLPKVQEFPNKWCAAWRRNRFYCSGYSRKLGSVSIHRVVMNTPKGMFVDHINGDTLDNRKLNLRIVSNAENLQNRVSLNKNNRSGIRGVTWNKQTNSWCAQLKVNRKQIFLGRFKEISMAEVAVSKARAEFMPFSSDAMK